MKAETNNQNGGPAKCDIRDYRTKCRRIIKESRHNAMCNLEVLQSQTITPATGLTQADMIAILKEVIQDWNEGTEKWVKSAKQTIKSR